MTTEVKVIGGVILVTIIIFIGGIFFLSKSEETVPEADVVSRNGLHWHPRLTVYIKGKKQEFTDNIGLGAVHQPMHTHVEDYKSGVVHMEMQGVVAKDETKLGNFFRIWNKQFSSNTLFDETNGSEGTVKMLVNGSESKDFENYMMHDGDNIEIKYE
ncbi:MAG: hypothetical protein HYT08_02975 [Candidatus Levybacteria bacterium]|nr:hypothetical protein [Candidatus Levybacteria bacterium]